VVVVAIVVECKTNMKGVFRHIEILTLRANEIKSKSVKCT